MLRTMFGKLVAGAVVSLATLCWTSPADAFWRWHGSHGGSWGSSGGSSGSWGSSGGSWGHVGHWHRHGRHHGSWGGSWGSSGGSSGHWGSWGGSSGSWGSSGGGAYYAPMDLKSADPSMPAPMGAPAAPAPGAAPPPASPAPGQTTSLRGADGLLAVSVPEDAKIYVNGQPTTSTGGLRQYVSRDLAGGYNYSYEVRAEVIRDGRTIEQVKKIDLRAGETANLAFDFPAAESLETSLTVHVPADAKVYLAGNPTKASGETRVFRTTGLSGGNSWDDYTIRVEIERGGRTVTKEETITLKAGQSQELRFEFDGDKIASR